MPYASELEAESKSSFPSPWLRRKGKAAIHILMLLCGLSVESQDAIASSQKAIPPAFFAMQVNRPESCGNCTPMTPLKGKVAALRLWDAGIKWEEIEPSRGVYDWHRVDEALDNAAAIHVDVMYTFGTLAPWASPNNKLPLANPSDWTEFVAALVAHAAGRIKYWEMWNEPNGLYPRKPDQLLNDIVIPAYKIIKADPNELIVTSPAPAIETMGGFNDGADWMNAYLTIGGANYADVMAIHQYPPDGESSAESLAGVIRKFQAVFSAQGVDRKPFWGTEGSYGKSNGGNNLTPSQVGYVAKQALLLWSGGISRNYWYGYDDPVYGTLCTVQGPSCDPRALATGIAYFQTFHWLSNASLKGPCQARGHVWSCTITRSDNPNYSGIIVWNSSHTSKYSLESQYVSSCTLEGTYSSNTSNMVSIGVEPVLFETARTAC